MRLHVFLAQAGVASRRAAEKLISGGRVTVNGEKISTQGFQINPAQDSITVDGQNVSCPAQKKRYFLFHKPAGVVSTIRDRHAEKTIADFFRDIPEKLVPAGRLDKNSTGLMFMTNDGNLIYRLTHPRYQVERSYRVKVKGDIPLSALKQLEKGILLEGRKTAPCKIRVMASRPGRAELLMTLQEGRKREIREMIKKMGCSVLTLHRESFGCLRMGSLRAGERRELAASEVEAIRRFLDVKASHPQTAGSVSR